MHSEFSLHLAYRSRTPRAKSRNRRSGRYVCFDVDRPHLTKLMQPFNNAYNWQNTTDNLIIPNATISALNSYSGGAFQQATSVVTQTNQLCYGNFFSVPSHPHSHSSELIDPCFSVYGFEVSPRSRNNVAHNEPAPPSIRQVIYSPQRPGF